MNDYPLYLLLATLAISSPGPGVMMTLTNSFRYPLKETSGGILGISVGAFIVAGISATSIGVILDQSAFAFVALKYIGALYLFILGVRLWRASAIELKGQEGSKTHFTRCLLDGLGMQLTNPKVYFFFLSVFPQFIETSQDYVAQFSVLVVTYSILVILIHSLYAQFVKSVRRLFLSRKIGTVTNKLGGAIFMILAVALALSKR